MYISSNLLLHSVKSESSWLTFSLSRLHPQRFAFSLFLSKSSFVNPENEFSLKAMIDRVMGSNKLHPCVPELSEMITNEAPLIVKASRRSTKTSISRVHETLMSVLQQTFRLKKKKFFFLHTRSLVQSVSSKTFTSCHDWGNRVDTTLPISKRVIIKSQELKKHH